jgi:hypothetical protein
MPKARGLTPKARELMPKARELMPKARGRRHILNKRMSGGGDQYMTGVDINNISEFNPSKIAGINLWIKAADSMCEYKTVAQYTANLDPAIADKIRALTQDNLLVQINSPIVSQPNSLVRLELDAITRTNFPKLTQSPEELDAISIQSLIDPNNGQQSLAKLITKSAINMPSDSTPTIFVIGTNVNVTYKKEIDRIVVSVADITAPITSFSEIIVYSRPLTPEETEAMEGYLAYKRNDQYLLKFDHKYLPSIQSFPALFAISNQLVKAEISIVNDLKAFDSAVTTYREKLPDAEIISKAPGLKEKGTAAQRQLSTIRQAFVKGALLSRKKGQDSVDAVFESINALGLFSEPFARAKYDQKIADFGGVMRELEAYMSSLGNVDAAAATDETNKNQQLQIQRRSAAQSLEAVENTQDEAVAQNFYKGLRATMESVDRVGKLRYETMYANFAKRIVTRKERIDYYNTATTSRWNDIDWKYKQIREQIEPETGTPPWLGYDSTVDTANKSIMRNGQVHSIHYSNPYLNRIQALYEQIRNQMEEGDALFLKNEINYIATTVGKISDNVQNRTIVPISKTLFCSVCKRYDEKALDYSGEFEKLYVIINEAITALLDILRKNKEYKTSSNIEKDYPIPLTFLHRGSTTDVYVRRVNKHDSSLTMIEYIVTGADGTVLMTDEGECEFMFPAMQTLTADPAGKFFTRPSAFRDETGAVKATKYIVLDPYKKTESILDTLPSTQATPRFYHLVDGLFEIPRDAENSIYEMSMETPQMPVLLPKYAVTDGAFFVCVNVGKLALHVRIPTLADYIVDLIGPGEICMYVYSGMTDSKDNYYGRVQWIPSRIPYDTLLDVPRTSIVAKVAELDKTIFMQTATLPLFDRDGYLIEANPDKNGVLYDIDDIFRAKPYKTTMGKEIRMSDLEVREDWGEQLVPSPIIPKLCFVREASTDLPVFCNDSGIPAIDEFGYTKYLQSPALHVQDAIKTRSSLDEPIIITPLPAETSIAQYGMSKDKGLFKKVYRSRFVKPAIQDQQHMFIFVNMSGFPLVSPSNNYIEAEKATLSPPIMVEYVENLIPEYAYILEDSPLFVPSKTPLKASPMPIESGADDNLKVIDTKRAIKIVAYRYDVSSAYITYTLAKLKEEIGVCESMQANFADIDDTIEMLETTIEDIKGYQADFASYGATIAAIRTRSAIMDKTMDEKMEMSTFDLKMKDTIGRVYTSFTAGLNRVNAFRTLLKLIENIRAHAKRLRTVVAPENDKSILGIQVVIQNDGISSGGQADRNLTRVLEICTQKKMEFDATVKKLEERNGAIPKYLDDIQAWFDTQSILVKNANALRREIVEYEINQSVNIFTQKIASKFADTSKKVQDSQAKVDVLIEYKKAIAKWLGIYVDKAEMRSYTNQIPSLFPSKTVKGYFLPLPVFEEMENPLVSRDWYALANTGSLSEAIRLRISMGLIDPIKTFITENTAYYTNYDIHAYGELNPNSRKTDEEILQVVEDCKKRVDAFIAEAIEVESKLGPIFDFYKDTRIDIATELRPVLEAQARNIMEAWTKCADTQTAIQTKIKYLEPYLDEAGMVQARKIGADMEGLFSDDLAAAVENVRRSTKVADFYVSMNHLKMIEIRHERLKVFDEVNGLQGNLVPIQDSMEDLDDAVLANLRGQIETKRANLMTRILKMKAEAADPGQLSRINDAVPQKMLDDIASKNPPDIPGCVELLKAIEAVPISV